jgi:hypothetical protein
MPARNTEGIDLESLTRHYLISLNKATEAERAFERLGLHL